MGQYASDTEVLTLSRKVDACMIMRDLEGKSRGFASLTFEDAESVNAVLARAHVLDGKTVRTPLRVHLSNADLVVQIDPKRAISVPSRGRRCT